MLTVEDAIDLEAAVERADYHPDVLAALDPARTQALADAEAQLSRATERVQLAQERLATCARDMPDADAAVAAWAKRKGVIQDELSAYETIQARARQALSAAQEALNAAYVAQWRISYDAAIEAFHATREAASTRERAWQSAGLVMQWENSIDITRAATVSSVLWQQRPLSVTDADVSYANDDVRMARNAYQPPHGTQHTPEAEAARASRATRDDAPGTPEAS